MTIFTVLLVLLWVAVVVVFCGVAHCWLGMVVVDLCLSLSSAEWETHFDVLCGLKVEKESRAGLVCSSCLFEWLVF